MNQPISFALTLLSCLFALGFSSASAQQEPLTVAEQSNYRATSRSAEVESFLEICAERADHVDLFKFGETVEGRDMLGVQIANPPYESREADDRLVALIIGNIHSGECSGKESLLQLTRELSNQPDHVWLENLVLVIVPNYNADGNDKIDPGNRPGQIGPEAGMGERANSQQLDLNRDFMKLESPEAQSLIGLMNQLDPELFIDCHTTNGSRHRYCLTYDIPHNPTAPQDITQYLRNEMMPAVTESLLQEDKNVFYYGNFNRDRSRWSTYGDEPRYSTEYGGLRGGLAILSEAYSYISYQERIEATHSFVSECVNYVSTHSDEVRSLIQQSRQELAEAAADPKQGDPLLLLSHRTEQVAFDEQTKILSYEGEDEATVLVEFYGKYVAIESRTLPYAYLVPSDLDPIVEKLQQHGIVFERLEEAVVCEVERSRCEDFRLLSRAFQGHNMATYIGERYTERVEIPSGTIIVKTSQPLGRLAGYLLDPHSNDGLTTWNYFDDQIEIGQDHPIWCLPTSEGVPH